MPDFNVSEYYDTTLSHYRKWWKLDQNLSLHYGIWSEGVNSFTESLINTNRILMKVCKISESDSVLDAGCGVGGAAMFLNKEKNCRVTGISLSQKQVDFANSAIKEQSLTNEISFHVMDYTQTDFDEESFDVIWACESVCHAHDKRAFLREAFRLLKKGGRLILSDFFISDQNQDDPDNLIKKWSELWGVPGLVTPKYFEEKCTEESFKEVQSFDYTDKILKTSKRLYYASLSGAIPSEIYNLFHPAVSRYAKKHYLSGYYQYKALKRNLWRYVIFLAIK